MKNQTYLQHAKILRNKIDNTKFNDMQTNGLIWPYLVISSNLSTFLPQLKVDEHYNIIKDMEFHRSLSNIELLYPSLLKKTKIYDKSDVVKYSSKQSHIFVSYHSGPYNMFLRHLANKNVPFCVVSNKYYLKNNEEKIHQLYNDISNKSTKKLEMFSSEDPNLLLKLMRKLREGISVYIFIDGNSGTKKNNLSKDKNLLKINFLNNHIYARQGVAFLAYLSKSPIATIMAKRDENLNNTININLIKTKDIIQKHSRNDFIYLITQKIYSELEIYLKNNYKQWSGWFYIHNFFDTDALLEKTNSKKKKNNFKVNTLILNRNFHIIKHSDEHIFLVKKKNYQIVKIKKYLYEVLTHFKTPRKIIPKKTFNFDNQEISWSFVNELIKMNYLKPI